MDNGNISTSRKFALGQVVMTPGAAEAFAATGEGPLPLLARHQRGDWGTVNPEDATENEVSVARGFRVLSTYELKDGTQIWVLTEADRSATTILLPDEY